MNIKRQANRLFGGIMLIAAISLVSSCETEYNDRVREIPGDVIQVPGYTHIESFSFSQPGESQPIGAAVTENEIVVLWSAFKQRPETIIPTILLGEGAVITPASGVAVPFVNGTVYTVTSEAGTTKRYTLKIDLRQQEPTYTRLGDASYDIGALQKEVNIGISGSGAIDNLLLDVNQTRVYFVAASDEQTEYEAEVVFVGLGVAPFNDYGIYYFLPENMPAGMYDIRIENGQYLLINPVENRFKNEVKLPEYLGVTRYGFPAVKAAGQTVEARGTLLNQVTGVEIYSNTDPSVVHPLEIVSSTNYRITLKIPAGTPAGSYNRMRFTYGTETMVTANAVTVQ